MTADGLTGRVAWLLDRTAVLCLGVGVGIAIGLAFAASLQSPAPASNPSGIAASTRPQGSETRPQGSETRPQGSETLPNGLANPTESLTGTALSLPLTSTQECALRYAPSLTRAVTEGRPVRIAVLGDSFGEGLWSALYNQLPAKAGYDVLRYSQQSTGFTRYTSLNLEEKLAEQLADGPVDIAVISFGANDTQGIYANGHGAALLTPAWQAEIGARISRYVTRLRTQGAQVYWVGLPVMRAARYNADIEGLNAFYAGLMTRLDVPFVETRSRSVDGSGNYAAYLPDPVTGAPRLMRANDGVHMSMGGYKHLTALLAIRIVDHVAAARRDAAKANPAISKAAPGAAT